MQLRRALPLTLAALVLATGCVTVRPAVPPGEPRPLPGPARPEPARPEPVALPLGRLPSLAESAPAAPAAAPPAPGARTVPGSAADAPGSRPAARPSARPGAAAAEPRRPRRVKAGKPIRRTPAAAPARARKQAPAKARSRPAPRRTYDMAPLCEAARGTVSPSIVALCR